MLIVAFALALSALPGHIPYGTNAYRTRYG